MLDYANSFEDVLRGMPYYILITAVMCLCTSSANAAEFNVNRMTQFDVQGTPYGCRSSALNLEAKGVYSWSTSRHCVITKLQDLSIDHYQEIRAKAGGLVVVLPKEVDKLSLEDQQQVYMLEQAMMAQEISIPVYFSRHTEDLEKVALDLVKAKSGSSKQQRSRQQSSSAMSDIINTVSANGYQVVVSGASHAANKQSKINIIQGELAPASLRLKTEDGAASGKLPTIIVTAQLQTLGLINQQVKNEDVSVLLTLVDAFSKLYNTATAPKYRIMFLITESNHLLNFQGTKKWLDANFDDNSQVNNVEFVVCLDAISRGSDSLFMHVSKPPKEGTQIHAFFKSLKATAKRFSSGDSTVEGVHKKINLADVLLAWEHERFSMKRLPAFTMSNLKNHKDPMRSSVFVAGADREAVLVQNTKIIAESLANYIFRLDGEGEIFTGTMEITKESLRPWEKMPVIGVSNDLKNAFEKYLKNVKVTNDKPDPREPDFMLYDGSQDATLNVYHVKPAIFDLFLTMLISLYLVVSYFCILYFPKFYTAVCKLTESATSSYVQLRPKVN